MKNGTSLNKRLTSLVAILLVVIGGLITTTLWVTNAKKTDGLVINLAGRQRMLTQKFAKEVLQELHAGTQLTAKDTPSQKTRALFEATQLALEEGGQTYADVGMTQQVHLPATTDAEIKAKLLELHDLWRNVCATADAVRAAKPGTPTYDEAYQNLAAGNVACLKQANVAVGMYQARFDGKIATLTSVQYVAGIGSVLVFAGIIMYIRRRVCKPLTEALTLAKAAAAGDLTKSCPVTTNDEVGQVASALNDMCVNLSETIGRILGGASNVSKSSIEMLNTATDLTGGAHETSQQSATVAAAAEEMATNMQSMASSSEEMSANVKTVAAAVEEMTASIGEVAQSAGQAAEVAGQAAGLAKTSNDNIGELGTAADAIGKVIDTIEEIAEQTNLLALNATIEAARAGDAGKGFAVVANEVKDLAKQTAEATEDIRKRIEGIQSSTGSAIESIGQISEVITKVDQVSRSIATAVEQQSSTTQEIAQNIAQTAGAAESVSVNVAETAEAVREVTKSIAHVDGNAKMTAQHAQKTESSGQRLSTLAATLQMTVDAFRISAEARKAAATSDRVIWDARTMGTTSEKVDEQHRTLFAKINDILEATEKGHGKEEISGLLDFLYDYTRTHFAHEEKLMAEVDCPIAQTNKELHVKFFNKFDALMERYKNEGPTNEFLIDLQQDVCVWLAKHIRTIDVQLRECAIPAGA